MRIGGHFPIFFPDLLPEGFGVHGQRGLLKPTALTLDAINAAPRQEVTFTLECSGNNGLPFFRSAVWNAQWAGTGLADVLRSAGIQDKAVEVVFYGADQGEDVANRGAPYEVKYTDTFARGMSIADAMNPANILCYEMNGVPLPAANGYPLRLIAPGWLGIANVKWLTHIEVLDHRYPGRFMSREYVTSSADILFGTPLGRPWPAFGGLVPLAADISTHH
jgi:DMSO/TMAO reductase YedYZ molybdopterin-dependent catalytic subunit